MDHSHRANAASFGVTQGTIEPDSVARTCDSGSAALEAEALRRSLGGSGACIGLAVMPVMLMERYCFGEGVISCAHYVGRKDLAVWSSQPGEILAGAPRVCHSKTSSGRSWITPMTEIMNAPRALCRRPTRFPSLIDERDSKQIALRSQTLCYVGRSLGKI